ncbi:MAG: hypothetical protein IIB40_05755 [Candidatus Marinimicrobia bacterium]|nr:hypothetical protein [Candidatus Neomarinimicrobiota bacterium]
MTFPSFIKGWKEKFPSSRGVFRRNSYGGFKSLRDEKTACFYMECINYVDAALTQSMHSKRAVNVKGDHTLRLTGGQSHTTDWINMRFFHFDKSRFGMTTVEYVKCI